MFVTTKALVIKRTRFGESHEYLRLLTEDMGVITVCAMHVRSLRCKYTAACQLFSYSEFVLKGTGDSYTVKSAELIVPCIKHGCSIEEVALASYFASLAADVGMSGEDSREVMRMTVNAMCIISKSDRPLDLIKAVYELRLMKYAGLADEELVCSHCSTAEKLCYLPSEGGFVCTSCALLRGGPAKALGEDVLKAVHLTLTLPEKSIYTMSFTREESLYEFSKLCEEYVISQLSIKYKTLDFYNSLKNLGN